MSADIDTSEENDDGHAAIVNEQAKGRRREIGLVASARLIVIDSLVRFGLIEAISNAGLRVGGCNDRAGGPV
jgi:hypothetical protein